jgi:hypothetical protein
VKFKTPGAPVSAYLRQYVLVSGFCLFNGGLQLGAGIGFGVVNGWFLILGKNGRRAKGQE